MDFEVQDGLGFYENKVNLKKVPFRRGSERPEMLCAYEETSTCRKTGLETHQIQVCIQ